MTDLPPGWVPAPTGWSRELAAEIHPEHGLAGQVWIMVATRGGRNDDALVKVANQPDHWMVVHLTWSGHAEQGSFPIVRFDGTMAELLSWEASDIEQV